jgi:hypothetical protein
MRQHFAISQERLGVALGTSQPGVKKVETSTDPHISTVRRYVKALGDTVGRRAELIITASIGEESFVLRLDEPPEPLPPLSPSGPRAWRLRAWDDLIIEQAMLDRSLIAISADEIGDVTNEPSVAELRARLRAAPALAGRSEQALGLFVTYWRTFRSEMQIGDVVAVPLSGRRVAIGEISGGYRYERHDPEPRLRHVRDVSWLATMSRDSLDEDLRRVVNAPGTICSIGAQDAGSRLLNLVR